MSWFKKTIAKYEVDGESSTATDVKNPYMGQVFEEEEFKKVTIVQSEYVLPEAEAKIADGSSNQFTNLPSRP